MCIEQAMPPFRSQQMTFVTRHKRADVENELQTTFAEFMMLAGLEHEYDHD